MLERHVIGVDLGATNISAGRIESGKIEDWVEFAISTDKEENVIIQEVISAIEKVRTSSTEAIGVGVPSVVDTEKGIVFDVQNIPSWKEVYLKALLEKYFNVPVYLDNDANCFALGEAKFGKGKDENDFVGLTLGTGMGGGIIKDGFLLPDAHCSSGEFGSIPYLDSTYEDYCSGKFFMKKFSFKGEEMAEAAARHDKFALRAFDEFGQHLGNAIKTIKLAVDPRKVIIGGSVAQASEFFKNSMWKSLLEFPFPRAMRDFDVIFSDDKNIAVLGAASLYLDRTKQRSLESQEMENN